MNITLKSIPANLHARLRDSAKRNGRSLNAEITAILEKSCMAHAADRADLLERIRQTRHSLGLSFNADEIASARKEGRA
jgi:antitoxin FitA